MAENIAGLWGTLTQDEKQVLLNVVRSVTFMRSFGDKPIPSHLLMFLDRQKLFEVVRVEYDSTKRLCGTKMFDPQLQKIQKNWGEALPHYRSLLRKLNGGCDV